MRRRTTQITIFVLLLIITEIDLYSQTTINQTPGLLKKLDTLETKYNGSNYQGNYVWGGAINLAWNDLITSTIKETIQLNIKNEIALQMVCKFNNSNFGEKYLDINSYYLKTGLGQKTVDAINRETKIKFPGKSFKDLPGKFSDRDMIAYAYYFKQVTYPTPFTKDDMLFNGENVINFYAKSKKERENVRIFFYENKGKFIIGLTLKEEADELILAKGYNMRYPEEAVNALLKYRKQEAGYMDR